MRRVLVCGSRTWTDAAAIKTALWSLNPATDTIIHGACASGADRITHQLARERGFAIRTYSADWDSQKRAAGPIRNREMVDSLTPGRDLVLAFLAEGNSPGTIGTIELDRDRHVTVRVFRPDGTSYAT